MEKIVKETKYMTFELIRTLLTAPPKKKPKTNKYRVCNKKLGDELGTIEWYNYWRQYIFEPSWERQSCVFNHTCLREIADFLQDLNTKHKEKKNQGM